MNKVSSPLVPSDTAQIMLSFQIKVGKQPHAFARPWPAYQADQQRREALTMAVEANRNALDLAVNRYKQGLSSFVDVLTDEQNLLNPQQQNIQSTQIATTTMVELYKALGGGWETEFPVLTK